MGKDPVLRSGILEKLRQNGVELEFAMEHMFNIVEEFGVSLRVDKHASKAVCPQDPQRELASSRGKSVTQPKQSMAQRVIRRLNR